jgi:hypothetical protein
LPTSPAPHRDPVPIGRISAGISPVAKKDYEDDRDILEAKAYNNTIKRAESINRHLHFLSVIVVYVVALACLSMFLVLVYNKAAPLTYRFLTNDDEASIYQFLFTGVLGGVVARFGQNLWQK